MLNLEAEQIEKNAPQPKRMEYNMLSEEEKFALLPEHVRNTPRRTWTQDEAILYEVARECLTMIMGIYMSQIYEERAKENPDVILLERLKAEHSRLWAEQRNLRVGDTEEANRICDAYGPIIRNTFGRKNDS